MGARALPRKLPHGRMVVPTNPPEVQLFVERLVRASFSSVFHKLEFRVRRNQNASCEWHLGLALPSC